MAIFQGRLPTYWHILCNSTNIHNPSQMVPLLKLSVAFLKQERYMIRKWQKMYFSFYFSNFINRRHFSDLFRLLHNSVCKVIVINWSLDTAW
jgi:hypothetical protein